MAQDLLTTREVAKVLGVGTTSIKRWADSGLLRCVKTPGGHRRFPRDAGEEFMARHRHQSDGTVTIPSPGHSDTFIGELTNGVPAEVVVRKLEAQRREKGSWAAVAEGMTDVLEEIGRSWARGDISVIQEHIASERLSRAFSRCADSLERHSDAPVAAVMLAEADEHTLGLHLLELCLREAGWNVYWIGRKTPIHFACEFIVSHHVQLLAVSASEYSRDSASLADQAARLGHACRKRGIPLLLGGSGLWPEKPNYGHRMRSFAALRSWLSEYRRP